MLFFGSSTIDLKITIFLLVISLLISLAVWLYSKKIVVAFLILSVLSNASFLVNIGSEMFDFYNIVWFLYFSVLIWPIINIILIIYYLKSNPKK